MIPKIVDIWEADVKLDVPILLDAGVIAAIVRLNDINGGHHLDELLYENWARAKLFPAQAIYFVYNPWKSGKDNYDWLYSNLPNDYGKRRIFSDIEVRYNGYSPDKYSEEVFKFKALVERRNLLTKYTGAGYLGLLSEWPGGSYWWARYPYIVAPPNGLNLSWAELDNLLAQLKFTDAAPNGICPGKVDLWQVTDRVILPGVNGRAIDISIMPENTTIAQAKQFFNVDQEAEVPVGLYGDNAKAIFLYDTHVVTDVEALRGHVDVIIGYAGVGNRPTVKFKEWAEVAKTLDVPFLGYVSSDPELYIPMTYNPSMWPDAAHDPTCNMLDKVRKYDSGVAVPVHGWIVDGSMYKKANGTGIEDTWIASIWDHTFSRIFQRFGKLTFPLLKKETLTQKLSPIPPAGTLITALSKMGSLSTYEPAIIKVPTGWSNQFVPSDVEGPKQPYAPRWDFWWYGAAVVTGVVGAVPMFMYNGTPETLYSLLNFVPGTIPPTTLPPELEEIVKRLDALETDVRAIKAYTDKQKSLFAELGK